MRLFRPLLALSVVLAAAGACKHTPTDPSGKTITTTKFTCDAAGGGSVGCDITIPSTASKLRITFTSHDCDAHGNVITIAEPTVTTLSTDACYETVPKTIEIPGPFSTTRLAMKVTSKYIANPPDLRVKHNCAPWPLTVAPAVAAGGVRRKRRMSATSSTLGR